MVKGLIDSAAKNGVKLVLPTDIVVAPTFAADATPTLVSADKIPADQMGLDIGPESAAAFAAEIAACKTVFWNGPMGVFEFPNFAAGTPNLLFGIAIRRSQAAANCEPAPSAGPSIDVTVA